jgi:hypothetical protein
VSPAAPELQRKPLLIGLAPQRAAAFKPAARLVCVIDYALIGDQPKAREVCCSGTAKSWSMTALQPGCTAPRLPDHRKRPAKHRQHPRPNSVRQRTPCGADHRFPVLRCPQRLVSATGCSHNMRHPLATVRLTNLCRTTLDVGCDHVRSQLPAQQRLVWKAQHNRGEDLGQLCPLAPLGRAPGFIPAHDTNSTTTQAPSSPNSLRPTHRAMRLCHSPEGVCSRIRVRWEDPETRRGMAGATYHTHRARTSFSSARNS